MKASIHEGNTKIEACYADPSKCPEASKFLNTEWREAIGSLPHNPYDYTKSCRDLEVCYEEAKWSQQYLSHPHIKARLGANPDIPFSLANDTILNAFLDSGDAATRTSHLLPKLIKDNVRVLFMNGDHDTVGDYVVGLLFPILLHSSDLQLSGLREDD
jgi:carboxypeptidase C (cathepsin A)